MFGADLFYIEASFWTSQHRSVQAGTDEIKFWYNYQQKFYTSRGPWIEASDAISEANPVPAACEAVYRWNNGDFLSEFGDYHSSCCAEVMAAALAASNLSLRPE